MLQFIDAPPLVFPAKLLLFTNMQPQECRPTRSPYCNLDDRPTSRRQHPSDVHYPPAKYAELLIEPVKTATPGLVADFCAGNGSLLQAAERTWPHASYAGTDLDATTIAQLSRERTSWHLARCDFLSQCSRQNTPLLRMLRKTVDLVLLNPPFTCKGNTRHQVQLHATNIECGTAMAFLLHSLDYLSSSGELVAILPAGSAESEKDSLAWQFLAKLFDIRFFHKAERGTFPGCAARSHFVHLSPTTRRLLPPTADEPISVGLPIIRASLLRGNIPIHRASTERTQLPLFHSTDLPSHPARQRRPLYVAHSSRLLQSSAILIPRVGVPTLKNIHTHIHASELPLALSDCVIAILPRSRHETDILARRIAEHLTEFSDAYIGTGAKYITMRHLRKFLAKIQVIT